MPTGDGTLRSWFQPLHWNNLRPDQGPPLGRTFIFLIDLYWALGSRSCSVIILVDSIKWLDKDKVTFAVFAALCRTLMSLKAGGGGGDADQCIVSSKDLIYYFHRILSFAGQRKQNLCFEKGFPLCIPGWNSLCSPRRPQTHRSFSGSASCVLGIAGMSHHTSLKYFFFLKGEKLEVSWKEI